MCSKKCAAGPPARSFWAPTWYAMHTVTRGTAASRCSDTRKPLGSFKASTASSGGGAASTTVPKDQQANAVHCRIMCAPS